MKAQPDSPAHTVGGACQPPSKLGGYPQGTVWCCATCKAFWFVNDDEWEFLSRPHNDDPTVSRENFSLRQLADPQVLTITGFAPYDGEWVRHKPQLPTVPSVIRATVNGQGRLGNGTGRLLYGPIGNGVDKDWCDATTGYAILAQDIESFEVLWTEGERGKDALVPWELIDKLRDAYPSDPGAYMTPVDFFLREVVRDR